MKTKETTIKGILIENRKSIISSIKWDYKIYSQKGIKEKMVLFLDYMEKNGNLDELLNSTKIKTELVGLLNRMMCEQVTPKMREERLERRRLKEEENLRLYGKTNPKLEDILSGISEQEERKGKFWNPVLKDYV